MHLLSSDTVPNPLKNIIHEDTQLHSHHIDLTVKAIQRPEKAASLDFGGSEFEAAGRKTIQAVKQNPDDDYGWWNLQAGIYWGQFNEKLSLPDGVTTIITPHAHARAGGLIANSYAVTKDGSIDMAFQVPACGCNIKENARIAAAYFINVKEDTEL